VGQPLQFEVLSKTDRIGGKAQIFNVFSLVAVASAVTPSEKS